MVIVTKMLTNIINIMKSKTRDQSKSVNFWVVVKKPQYSHYGSFLSLVTYNYLDILIGHPKSAGWPIFSIIVNKISNH